jgi:hypothetical protein
MQYAMLDTVMSLLEKRIEKNCRFNKFNKFSILYELLINTKRDYDYFMLARYLRERISYCRILLAYFMKQGGNYFGFKICQTPTC